MMETLEPFWVVLEFQCPCGHNHIWTPEATPRTCPQCGRTYEYQGKLRVSPVPPSQAASSQAPLDLS